MICVLLLEIPVAGESGNLLAVGSLALAGALPVGVVLDRSIPADFGPSANPTSTLEFGKIKT